MMYQCDKENNSTLEETRTCHQNVKNQLNNKWQKKHIKVAIHII